MRFDLRKGKEERKSIQQANWREVKRSQVVVEKEEEKHTNMYVNGTTTGIFSKQKHGKEKGFEERSSITFGTLRLQFVTQSVHFKFNTFSLASYDYGSNNCFRDSSKEDFKDLDT